MELPDIDLVRAVPTAPAVARADGDNGQPVLSGHFSTFNTWYEIDSYWEGRFLERIAPGAFAETIAADRDQMKVTFNHGHDFTMGDQVLGSIRELREDETGPYYEVPLFSGVPALVMDGLRAGVYGSSFRFRVTAEEWDDEPGASEDNPNGWPERTLTRVQVMEFGPVTFPANPSATASARSLTDEFYDRLRSTEPSRYDAAVRAAEKVSTGRPGTRGAGGGGNAGTDGSRDESAEPPPPEPEESKENRTMPKNTGNNPADGSAELPVTPDERNARLVEIRARYGEIDNEHTGELPADVQEEWDGLEAEEADHERALAAVAKRREKLSRAAASEGNTERANDSVRNAPNMIPGRSTSDIYDLGEIRKQARSFDDLGRLYTDNARRAVEQARYPGVSTREAAQTQAERLLTTVDDDEGTLARRILTTGSPTYRRAFGKALLARSTNGLTGEEQRAMSLGTDSEGGYAVPFDLDPTVILTSGGSVNPLREVARVEQIVGKAWQGITSAGITVTRSPEAQEATDNSPTLAQPEVAAKRVLGFVPFSQEIDQDWSRLQSEMTMLLADAKDQEEADAFVNGDGTGANPGGIIATLAAGSQVGQTGADGDLTVPDDLHAVEEDLGPRFRARASWLANKSIYNLIRSTALSAGLTAEDVWVRIASGQPNELIGYAARELSTMDGTIEATGAGDNLVLLFGDYATGFIIVDRVGMNVEIVPHLFGATNRFPTGQRGVVALWRNGSAVLAPNALRVLNVVSPV